MVDRYETENADRDHLPQVRLLAVAFEDGFQCFVLETTTRTSLYTPWRGAFLQATIFDRTQQGLHADSAAPEPAFQSVRTTLPLSLLQLVIYERDRAFP